MEICRRKLKICSWSFMIFCLGTTISVVYLVDWTHNVSTEFSRKTDLTIASGVENSYMKLDSIIFSVNNEINCCKCTLSEICLKKKKVVVIAVLSARNNFHRRATIRKSWGSLHENRRWCIKLIFILAENRNDNISDKITDESTIYKDIIVAGFTDTYRALTYKTLMSFKWFLDYCSEAKYILKTDDDVFIEMFQLLNHLTNLKNNNTISCKVHRFVVPQRSVTTNRWYITENEFSGDFYPDYCIGTGYLISNDVVKTLYQASLTLPANKIFWIEDVFVTGILREHLIHENIIYPKLVSFSSKYNEVDIEKWKHWYNNYGHRDIKLPWIFIQTYDEPDDEFEEDFIGLWNKTLLFYRLKR